ncbi:MAG TPA: fumarylacetoacetate hydrolase family protein [Stellaceae bacterium]|nr:fumarylacetoacetate hydrolase family protein [Stellaceae bacterium]
MKLVSYTRNGDAEPRLGAIVRLPPGSGLGPDAVVDLENAYAAYLRGVVKDPFAKQIAAVRIPTDMKRLLEGGELSLNAAKDAVAHIETLRIGDTADDVSRQIVMPLEAMRLQAPIARPGKIIAVGANYSGHIKEARDAGMLNDLPTHPVGFLKMPSAVIGPDETIWRSRYTDELDYEIEMSMVIGKRCRDVSRERWRDVVAGFTIVNDISMRDLIVEEKSTGAVLLGKNLDTTCPMGPCIVTLDEIGNPDALDIKLSVNGEIRQSDNTRNMIFSCADIIAYWSSRMTLEPGDIVTTGTTSGGAGFHKRHPARLLKADDVIEAECEGIGILRNRVADEHPRLKS